MRFIAKEDISKPLYIITNYDMLFLYLHTEYSEPMLIATARPT